MYAINVLAVVRGSPRNMIAISLVVCVAAAAILTAFAGSNVYALYAGTGWAKIMEPDFTNDGRSQAVVVGLHPSLDHEKSVGALRVGDPEVLEKS